MIRLLLLLGLVGCPVEPEPEPVDADGDGVIEAEDCDDADPDRAPGLGEACDGVDNDCDGSTEGESDGDHDGFRACADCDDERADVFPGAPVTCDGADSDCDGEVSEAEAAVIGDSADCPAATCLDLPDDLDSGLYWLDGGSGVAFRGHCELPGGWLNLQLDDSQGVVVASQAEGNPWHKCDDDGAAYWPWIGGEELVVPDSEPGGSHDYEVELRYLVPETGEQVPVEAADGLGARLTELHPDTWMVALTGDNDNGTWQTGQGSGLEVYAIRSSGVWSLLTPGRGHDCGGGSGWPAEGSRSGIYLWGSERSDIDGFTNLDKLAKLDPRDVLPKRIFLAVHTGGGVAFGWSSEIFRVR